MEAQGILQILVLLAVLTALTPLIGGYMAKVFTGRSVWLTPVLGPVERGLTRAFGSEASREQDWKQYAKSVIVFSAVSWLLLYLIIRTQSMMPFNPQGLTAPPWDLTFNTTTSFLTNTNWQFYGSGNAINTWYPCTIVDANGKEVPWVDAWGRPLATLAERTRPAEGQSFFIMGGGSSSQPLPSGPRA